MFYKKVFIPNADNKIGKRVFLEAQTEGRICPPKTLFWRCSVVAIVKK
jgi:hypothetical protein